MLSPESQEQKQFAEAIKIIAAGVGTEVGEKFFPTLVQHLAQVFAADYAFIGILDEYNPRQVNTIAVTARGEQISNFTYELDGTPCDQILTKQTCYYCSDVQKLFPGDELLATMGIDAYVGTALYDAQGNAMGLLVVLHEQPIEKNPVVTDILEIFAIRVAGELQRLRQESHIRRIAYEDYLTRLPNRALLHEALKSASEKVRLTGRTGALLLIDLDHFKTINDALGHDVGDEVLRAIARRLQQVIGPNELVGRLGGDEFVVLIKESDLDYPKLQSYAQALARRILLKLYSPVFVGERAFNVGASIGIALFPQDTSTEIDILRHADMALYRAKSLGRAQIQLYLPDLKAAAKNRLQLEDGLKKAIVNQELELHYQPQVGLQGEMLGAEVLLRWHHPELGRIAPGIFIPIAEDTGLIHSIGTWVFDQACKKLKQWLDDGYPFQGHLAINVCPWQFARPDFVDQLQAIIQHHAIAADRLVVELTETALLYDVQDTVNKLKTLRSLGIKIALDDFGTGYSSLSHLRDLPLDIIKIDQDFIHELLNNKDSGLVESIIYIGQLMHLEVVAEGVEEAAQWEKLKKLQCQKFQGYYFSRPLQEKYFLEWMAQAHTQAHPINLVG